MKTVLTGDPFNWSVERPTSIAIGVFDGVHRGHQAVMSGVVEKAGRLGLMPIALTFEPHPLEFLAPERAPKLLTAIDHRVELLGQCGVDVVGVLPFFQIRDLQPEVFATEILSSRLRAGLVAVGGDFRFGQERRGDADLLGRVGEVSGFEVELVSPVTAADGEVVSSTKIRAILGDGDVIEAARMLGRPFAMRSVVIHGDGRGRQIGFPTANLRSQERMMVPRDGVYAAMASWEGEVWDAVVNVGVRPTFGVNQRTVEAHVIGFDGDLYGRELTLSFVQRIREEKKFDSVVELSNQIARDREAARMLLGHAR